MRAVPSEDLRAALPAPRVASLRLQAAANALGSLGLYAVVFLLTPLAIRKLGNDGAARAFRLDPRQSIHRDARLGLSGSMLLLAALVTFPLALRRFPVPASSLFGRAVCLPLAVSLPALLVLAWRPRLGSPIGDLVVDAVVFGLCVLPGLEFARRRYLALAGSPAAQEGSVLR